MKAQPPFFPKHLKTKEVKKPTRKEKPEFIEIPLEDVSSQKIQIISDLHLDVNRIMPYNFPQIIKPEGDILCLLGDTAQGLSPKYGRFMSWAASNFKKVLFISGNHEYYQNSFVNIDDTLEGFDRIFPNVYYLNNRKMQIGHLTFLGTTLWSEIKEDAIEEVSKQMNDSKLILNFDCNQQNKLFQRNVKWLESEINLFHLNKNERDKLIVLSHHAPSSYKTSSPEYAKLKNNCAFASDLEDLVAKTDYWFFGHTHWVCERKIGNAIIASNPLGYRNECPTYSSAKIYEV